MRYVEPERQLVVETYVRNLEQSLEFYRRIGFCISRQETGFAEIEWEGSALFLGESPDYQRPRTPAGNVRIMVPDVDLYWTMAQDLELEIYQPIGDRHYGLRDFTILDPDGFGIRFGSYL